MPRRREISLRVEVSALHTGGRARVHDDVLEEVGVKAGSDIELISQKRTLKLRAVGDELVARGVVRIAAKDISFLKTRPGNDIVVRRPKSISENFFGSDKSQ